MTCLSSPNHTAPPHSPNNTFPFPASCILLSGIIRPLGLWSLSCSTHSGISKLHNCTTHLTFIAPLSPGHLSGLKLQTGDQWDAEFEYFSGRTRVTGHYLTHTALTNIPENRRMLGNSDWFFSVSFYPNMPRRCSFLRPVLRFPVCTLVLKQQRQVNSGAPSERWRSLQRKRGRRNLQKTPLKDLFLTTWIRKSSFWVTHWIMDQWY